VTRRAIAYSRPHAVRAPARGKTVDDSQDAALDRVFFALADPVRRAILERLDAGPLVVTELAEPFAITTQAVSRHIQVLESAGLVSKERTGRISRCSLEVGPIADAAVWINRYSKYWNEQFKLLALTMEDLSRTRQPKRRAQTRKSR
jgi:DNA-binding transcriptional ArsR family regulator